MYDKLRDTEGNVYYKRVAYARGRPNIPGVVEGEQVDSSLILPPNLKYVCRATLDVKKGYYGSNEKLDKPAEDKEEIPVPEPDGYLVVTESHEDSIGAPPQPVPRVRSSDFISLKPPVDYNSTLERSSVTSDRCYLYQHGGVWKIGPNYNSARALLLTSENNLDNIGTAEWFEVLRDTKNSKKVNPIQVSISQHEFKSDILFVDTSELSTRSTLQLNGAYKKLPGLDAWELVKSVYLSGKFQTQWKQEALVGWYDEVAENTFLRRQLVSLPLPTTHRDQQKVHIYLFGRRWHVGPNPLSKICWLFSAKTEKGCDEYVRWFEPTKRSSGKDKWVRNRTVTVANVK